MIRSRYVHPVDWFAVLTDLIRCGVSVRAAAHSLGVPYLRLYRAYRGLVDLRWTEGELVVSLWCDITRRTPPELPRLPIDR